nr:hypothetical protein [Tanacetum cinerariifolium]
MEVCQAVKEFFLNGKLLGEINATLISLVPKIPTLSDFRPIACCNVLYKCISKILTSRIKGVVGNLVGENQSAFIEGGRGLREGNPISPYLFTLVMEASVFLLPKQVIYEINKLLKGFIWCQGELTKGKAKVSWDKICKPKDQDGLGLKNLSAWNEVLMIKHLWNVAVKRDTFLRDKVRKHIGWKLGNGKSVNIWYDKWCLVCPLSDFIDTRDIYDARLSNNCTVNDLINEGRWKWPAEWSTDFGEPIQLQVPLLRDDIEDTAMDL